MWPFSCSILHQLVTSLFYFRSDSWKSIWTGLFFQEGHKNHKFLACLWMYSLWPGIFSWSDKAEPLHCMDDEVWRALGRQPDITNMSSTQSHCSHLDTNVLYFPKSCSWVWHHSLNATYLPSAFWSNDFSNFSFFCFFITYNYGSTKILW